ncbi:MAG: transpeptidase family protein [Chitinophagales bacterium]|nr:transpeptidase family protein [Chitinophagales bacterium]
MNIKTNILLRVYFIGLICAVFGIAIIFKVYSIQSYKGHYWKNLADSLSTKIFDIEAERGNIYSADDKLLATTIPYFELRCDFASTAMTDEIFDKNVDSLAYYMAKYFGKKTESQYRNELYTARKLGKRWHLIYRNADYMLLNKVKTWPLFREGKYKGGLIVIEDPKRKMPFGMLAHRTIGYVRDNAQDIGLESTYNQYLAGTNGKILKQRIAGGEWIPIKKTGQIEPKNGYDIVTTLDIQLQDIAENTLADALKSTNADLGCAVIMEVKTGAIKAMANLGKTTEGNYTEKYNYAVGLSNEPGSVFKTAAYLALFDDGKIDLEDSINTNYARAVFNNNVLTDDGHNTQYTFLKPAKALAISSNVAIAKWLHYNYKDNKKKFYTKLSQFGLTDKTHIEIEGEPQPFIRNPEEWSFMSLPWMAHGYEVKFTPLQILTFYNAIANKGTRMQPYLVQSITENNKTIESFSPKSNKTKICSEKAANYATQILLAVVEDSKGTGRKIRTPFYRIAGKTGTAKMSFDNKGYTNKNLSTFVGFFPADNPLYSCIVTIAGVEGEHTSGGAIAAPVFKTIADKIITSNIKNNKAINKDTLYAYVNPPIFSANKFDALQIIGFFNNTSPQVNNNWNFIDVKFNNKNSTNVIAVQDEDKKVPNVKGMLIDDALSLLENKGLRVVFTGKGKVFNQSLSAGLPIIKNNLILLELK